MKATHLVTALLASVVVMLSVNLAFGARNGHAYETLDAHRTRLEANVGELKERQRTLQARIELLRRSSDAVAVEARSLQYYDSDEIVIRIEGNTDRAIAQSPGRVILYGADSSDQRSIVRFSGIGAGVLVLLVLMMVDRKRDRRTATG
jgi:cell division protein FtsB